MRFLVIEDSPEAIETIKLCLTIRWANSEVISTRTGKQGITMASSETPDLIILDLGLPDIDGLEVLEEIRQFSYVPLIIVTSLDQEMSRVKGLELGADDYFVKPFSHTELLARVKAVLRRTQMHELWSDEGVISGGPLTVDLAARSVRVDGQDVHLTPTEWHLLAYLIRRQGRVISSEFLAEGVWQTEYISRSTITMTVRRLRIKLGDDPQNPQIIRSHRGMGYRFVLPK
ncbi:MAG: response regulator transcription factor [Thermaerobacterales bacterium]